MEKQLRELTETEEAICAASIENSILMRRIIRLMPRGEPTPDYLEMLYSYAKQRNRTADLVNALIGKSCPDVPRAGRDWYDWFQEVCTNGFTEAVVAIIGTSLESHWFQTFTFSSHSASERCWMA